MNYYIDGSCKGNPGIGGWSLIVVKDNSLYDQVGSFCEPPVTNNMMEITSLIHCLCYIINNKDKNPIIYTDSMYNINCYNNGRKWLLKDDLKNAAFVKTVCHLKNKINNHKYNLKILKVKGHSNDEWNDEADRLASLCASIKTFKYYKYKLPQKISYMISDIKYKGNLIDDFD